MALSSTNIAEIPTTVTSEVITQPHDAQPQSGGLDMSLTTFGITGICIAAALVVAIIIIIAVLWQMRCNRGTAGDKKLTNNHRSTRLHDRLSQGTGSVITGYGLAPSEIIIAGVNSHPPNNQAINTIRPNDQQQQYENSLQPNTAHAGSNMDIYMNGDMPGSDTTAIDTRHDDQRGEPSKANIVEAEYAQVKKPFKINHSDWQGMVNNDVCDNVNNNGFDVDFDQHDDMIYSQTAKYQNKISIQL